MGTKSKLFRVFVEGATISDGRQITAEMIDDIVATFNAETYSPRINVEHITGYSPEPPFNGYGDVIAVEARDDDFAIAGKTEKRRALYAQIDANDQMMALVKADQKPFPSLEITPSYAGTGKVGMVGLAFTDNPASIGTQRLKFSSHGPGNLFVHGNAAVALEFNAAPADPAKLESSIAGFFSALTARFKGGEPEKPKETTPPQPANDNVFDPAAFSAAMGTAVSQSIAAALKPVTDTQTAFKAEFDAFKAQMGQQEAPDTFSRPPATGGPVGAQHLTDC